MSESGTQTARKGTDELKEQGRRTKTDRSRRQATGLNSIEDSKDGGTYFTVAAAAAAAPAAAAAGDWELGTAGVQAAAAACRGRRIASCKHAQ